MIDRRDPLVTDTGSEAQTARARRRVRDSAAEERAVLRKVLSTYEGRRLVWVWIGYAGVFEDIAGTDAQVRELLGRRRLGLQLLGEASLHRELFKQMQSEAEARAEKDRKDAAAHRASDPEPIPE